VENTLGRGIDPVIVIKTTGIGVLDKLLQHPSNTCHVFIEALRKAGPNNNDLVERLVKLDGESTFPSESQVSSDDRLIGELIRYLRFCTVIGNSISNQV
jgi:hypothetical protein